ncbi:Lem3/Cdc50 [Sistotremastrum suecicum HHB10207 ss-3]|uniref:Lem3/Cdc50 n=1 Tax=Sistotremastrum suecicum HHB10207 ss-3 TaxID=1314776 RepID=A0A166IXH3_9AGAM|nr:Lem3/Cdc50 [Sistotremastrum suecicum HHB10207 ss-3]
MALFRRRNQSTQDRTDESTQQGTDGKTKGAWKRPANTAFKQQRLKAWQPILTPKTVLPTLLIIGLLFAPIGGLLVWGSGLVSQITLDYTNCELQPSSPSESELNFTALPHYEYKLRSADSHLSIDPTPQWAFLDNSTFEGGNQSSNSVCFLKFSIPADLQPSVFLYYKLTNFFQNHRRYVQSLDTDQLKGKYVSPHDLHNSDCKPLDSTPDGKAIYPCGLIANSLFNDTIFNPVLLPSESGSANVTYNFTAKNIAWPGEAKKYTNTPGYNLSDIVPPPNWAARFPNNYTEDNPPPALRDDEHFQNWMRTAGLPTFTKLYGRNDDEVMQAGTYQVAIWLNFPVTPYGGTKSLVISTVSWIGGKNPFLGWAYIGASALFLILAFAGIVRHVINPRRLGDMTLLSWNQPQAH